MYRKRIVLTMTALFAFCFAPVILWAQASSQGESFSDICLPSPETELGKDYLGLSSVGPFLLSHIKAEVLIIEIFSMYCPYCQREAPRVNELYRLIFTSPEVG